MDSIVKEILGLKELINCNNITGENGLLNVVEGITIMDSPNIVNWLNGNEILLANGYMLKKFKEQDFIQFIDDLVRKKVAALFLKLRYIKEIPKAVVDHAAQVNLPIVIIPKEFNWLNIATPINKILIEREYYFIESSLDIRNEFTSMIIKGKDADELCKKASELLGNPIFLLDDKYHPMTKINETQSIKLAKFQAILKSSYLKHNNCMSKTGNGLFKWYTLNLGESQLYMFPIKYSYFVWGYLSIFSNGDDHKNITEEDIFKIEQIITPFAFVMMKEKELNMVEKRYKNEFTQELIDGFLINEKEIIKRSASLDERIYKRYQVIIFEVASDIKESMIIEKLLGKFKVTGLISKDIFICSKEGNVVLLVPAVIRKEDGIDNVMGVIRETIETDGLFMGISSIHKLTNMKEAYKEAYFALSSKKLINQQTIYYDRLGLLRFFWEDKKRLDVPFIQKFYRRTFYRLVSYDRENNTDLVQTLEILLKNDLCISDTAQKLFIHENTLRARVKRIESICNCDIKKSYDLFELMLGLMMHQFIKL